MASKTDVQVLLGGKVYTLSGYESEEYLQKIALYINNKMTELNQMPGYKRMGSDMQKTLLELNMADDYYKARKRISELEADLEDKDKAEYDLGYILAHIHGDYQVNEIDLCHEAEVADDRHADEVERQAVIKYAYLCAYYQGVGDVSERQPAAINEYQLACKVKCALRFDIEQAEQRHTHACQHRAGEYAYQRRHYEEALRKAVCVLLAPLADGLARHYRAGVANAYKEYEGYLLDRAEYRVAGVGFTALAREYH